MDLTSWEKVKGFAVVGLESIAGHVWIELRERASLVANSIEQSDKADNVASLDSERLPMALSFV